jgi:phospholipase C
MPGPADKIKHLVVLMMENRSFDHMLGWMASPDYPIDGLTGDESNLDTTNEPALVDDQADFSGDLTPDPGHHYPDVNKQIFGNFMGVDDGSGLMGGFVKSYQDHTHDVAKSRRIMRCFDPAKIPVLSTLARQYAVSDRWFASVPGPTLPNRSYMHSATSIGRVDMSPIWLDESKTVYELLDQFGVSAKIYYHDMSMAMTFKMMQSGQGKWFGQFDDFVRACKKNVLPAYSFIEPRYNASDDGTTVFEAGDQHPDHNVTEGELLIRDVYNAVRSNQAVWESTILAIIYDEHGGLYDHVTPPATVNPDGKNCANPGENVAAIPPFDFKRLGVRVPAVIVSPYIKAGTISGSMDGKIYDHTSIIATARKLFLGDKAATNFLTERDRQAQTFDDLLTLDQPRNENIKFEGLEELIPSQATLRATNSLNKPLSTHQQAIVDHAAEIEKTFPADRRYSKTLDQITTEGEASKYLAFVTAELRREKTAGGGGV